MLGTQAKTVGAKIHAAKITVRPQMTNAHDRAAPVAVGSS